MLEAAPLLRQFFPGGAASTLSVFSFHRIPERDVNPVSMEFELAEFENILDVLEHHFRVLPLDEALQGLAKGRLPDRAVALTFDDGYVDWRRGVVPALHQRGMHATFFIACGQLSGQLLWYDRFRALVRAGVSSDLLQRVFDQTVTEDVWSLPEHDRPFVLERALKYASRERRDAVLAELEQVAGKGVVPDESLTDADIRTFHSMGFGIGAHTFTHPILASCPDEEAWHEIADSREYLEGVVGGRVTGFAYPNGKPHQDFTANHVDMVRRAGYEYAVSTARGVATAQTSRFAVPRFGPWSSRRFPLLRHMVMNRFERAAQEGEFGEPVSRGLQLSGAATPSHPAVSTPADALSVSVVIPVFNCWPLLGEAIDSVFAQSVPVAEVIVINDGSSDGDYQHFARKYPGVRVIDKPNEGVSASRNLGIREARGDIIAFLDADDVWLPGKLAAQLRLFQENPDVGVVFGRFEKWFADAAGAYRPWQEFGAVPADADMDPERSGWLYGKLAMGLLVGMNTAAVRRSLLLEAGGFDESRQIGEDYELWLRLSRITRMQCIRDVVALYRMRAGSAMHGLREDNELAQLLATARERWGLDAPNCSGLTESAYRRRMAQVYFVHGYDHFWRGSAAVAHQAFKNALGFQPEHVRARVYAVLSKLAPAVTVARTVGGAR
ncbi:MAG: hypothetical protein JWL63_339 [Rhodocyclales bacterium]|nr:hypothetical protein [Rhodocyclales bacterium]